MKRIASAILLLMAASMAGAAGIDKGPYLNSVDTTSVVVCWVTDVDEPSLVEYGTSRRLGQSVIEEIPGRQRSDRVWDVGGPEQLVAVHQVELTGLEPDARYYYRVKTGGLQSQIASFFTAVRPGTDFTFLAFGDMRPTDNHEAVIARALQIESRPRFYLNTGDMLSNGQRWPDWQGFFDVEAPLLREVPIWPCLGNHERDSWNYFQLFALPDNERWYSFDYGDVHVVALDSNGPYRGSSAQRGWLIQDLRKNYDAPYTFVFFHHPLYTCTNDLGRRLGGLDMQREWAPIFEAFEVTAVFNGHDHNYQHNVVNGVHYIVTGGGGASIYPVRPRSFTVKAAPVYHVVQVRIGRVEAGFTVIKADDGATVEAFALPRRDTSDLTWE